MAPRCTSFLRIAAVNALLLWSAVAQLVLTPSQDPFYQPPAGFQNTKPGTILRNRTIDASFFGLLLDPVQAYQILYRTTAINGSAIATVTTVFKPVNAKTDRFVSFQTAYDSSATICNPSYNYRLGSAQTDLISSLEFLVIQGFLGSGYIVSAPDYEGPDAAFGAGRLAGTGVLDSMRAVSNFHDTLALSSSAPAIVGVGYSGGAIATGWAASLQPSYASELPIRGWASGGTPSNLTGTLEFIDGTEFAGFIPASIDGLTKPSAYGAQLQPLISALVTTYGKSILDFANENCAAPDLLIFSGRSVLSTTFQSEGRNLPYDPTVAPILQKHIMGAYANETPSAPVFLYHAAQDEIIPYANASNLALNWCHNGASVNFVTYANGGHISTEIVAVPSVLNFVSSAFAGTVPGGCVRSTSLNNSLDPLAIVAELEPIVTSLLNALVVTGAQDQNIIANLSTIKQTL